MRRGFVTIGSVLILALAGAAACGDDAAPTGVAPSPSQELKVFDAPVTVNVLQRNTPLARDLTASAVIDRRGGTIEIRQAGLRFDVPSGALKSPVRITVTALAGSNVAYRFEPHGLVFRKDPEVRLDLRDTEAGENRDLLRTLAGAYYPDESHLGDAVAEILELRPTAITLHGSEMRFRIEHFSGYLASSGRSGYISSSGERAPVETDPLDR